MAKKLSLADLQVHHKRVLMRVDFNVPLDKKGNILDDTRIRAALPSIEYILSQGGKLILMSHLGRPKKGPEPGLSLAPCATRLSELLKRPVKLAPDCIGSQTAALVSQMKPGDVILLENLRFHEAEENPEKDPSFTQKLAALGECYVNDAFGTAHRAHASTAEIAKCFPNKSAAGFLMEKEINFFEKLLKAPEKPFYAILGGAKVSTKIGVLKALLRVVDGIFIGGGMSYTFFKAKGISIGNSIHEDDLLSEAKSILEASEKTHVAFVLPIDIVITDQLTQEGRSETIEIAKGIPQGFQGADIGQKTIQNYVSDLQDGKTIFWNGPMGVFEIEQFSKGTFAMAQTLSKLSATTVIGGGETIAAVEQAGVADQITHISTGGGAALEYIEYGTLPGIEALTSQPSCPCQS